MKRIALMIGLLLCLETLAFSAEKPNIVLIVSDDHHWNDYRFMNHAVVKTPNLDQLAKQGLVFTRGYVPSSLCCPSLASLITGQYPHQHCITGNDPPNPRHLKNQEFHQSPEFRDGRQTMTEHLQRAPTLPKLLAEEGYLSLQTGKWWLGHFETGGFSHGMTQGGRHGDSGLDIGRKTMKPIDDFLDLAKKENKPFFLWYAPMLPHQPHNPPEKFLNKYKDKTDSIHQAKYWANIEWFDETCGQLLESLESRGLREKTIIVYLADNGWIQNLDAPRFAPKSKQSQYDGGLRTPLILNWQGHIKPERDETHFVLSIDIAPTLLKLAGHTKAESQPGIDLLDAQAVDSRKSIYGECFTHDFVDLLKPEKNLRFRWMIEDGFKLIVAQPGEETGIELYYLPDDPHEETNLVNSHAQRVETMLPHLNSFYDPNKP